MNQASPLFPVGNKIPYGNIFHAILLITRSAVWTGNDHSRRGTRGQLHYLILLGFESLFLRGEQLALTLHAGLFVVLTLADFGEDTRLLALLLESA
jgi:hypothetical protein